MVGLLPAYLERFLPDGNPLPRYASGGTDIRCLWLVGLWCLHFRGKVVPAAVSRPGILEWPKTLLGLLCLSEFARCAGQRDTLCKFAAKMASEGLRHRTIKSYMAGIRHLLIEEGLVDPFLPALSRLHYVLRSVKRSQGEEGFSSRERLPITPPLLHQIKGVWKRLFFKSQKLL